MRLRIIITTIAVALIMATPAGAKVLNARDGVNIYQGHKETYYNLPMGKVVERADNNNLGGWYWVRLDGVKMYGYFAICAADYEKHAYGTIVDTSVGLAIVLDTGTFKETDNNIIDVAVDW